MFFDRHGRPISRATWHDLSTRAGYVTLTQDTIGGPDGLLHDVQTFWIGIGDRQHLLLFCTVVVHPHEPANTWGWRTEPTAKAGHNMISAWLTSKTDRPAGRRLPLS